MSKLPEDINIRSEEVQEIMSKIPNKLIRHGLSGMFILIALGLLLSWFIKYPEIINGSLILTTSVEPVKIVSQSSGVIKQLFVKDGDAIEAGNILAEIENPLSAGSVKYLRNYLTNLEKSIGKNDAELPLPDTSIVALGDLQNEVNGLLKELLLYNISANFKMDDVEIKSIENKIQNQKDMIAVNDKIIAITLKDLANAKIKFDADEKLFKENVISKMDFIQLESNYRSKELQLERLNQSQIDQKNILNSLELQYSQSGYNKFNKAKNNLEAIKGYIKGIKSYIYGWQQKYSLISSKAGKVSFLQRIQAGMFLKGGEELFAVTQPEGSYIGVAKVPASGYGKIKVGQDVHILLQSYPYYEYGMLEGKVTSFALFPNTNEYRVEISLPNGMLTSQKEVLKFTPEMVGDAEIITDDKRVLERVFSSVSKALKRK